MSGNVFEWCQDRFDKYDDSFLIDPKGPLLGSHRVIRGGGINTARKCRVSKRMSWLPDFSGHGFRLAL